MKNGLWLFITASIFGIAIATAYWLSSHDPTGTILLGIMAAALLFGAGYMLLAQRHADLIGDRAQAAPGDEKGVRIGVFTAHSPWPVVVALGAFLMLGGLTFSGIVAITGGCVLAYGIARLIIESR